MQEQITEKTITTELRPFCSAKGFDFFLSLKCRSDDNADIFNVIDNMEFKLGISYKHNEEDESKIEELFESPNWCPIEFTTRELDEFEYVEGCLDAYELTEDVKYFDIKLSHCVSDLFPDIENNDEEDDEDVKSFTDELIDNLTCDGDLQELMEQAVAQYIKTYF